MSDTSPFGFGRFVPGFDFLQRLAKGAAAGMPAMPALSGWVAPTVSVEELDKRIQELKAVQFWLEQNARAIAATVQALEVQKMTLATLQDMNMAMGDLAGTFGAARAATAAAAAPAASPAQPPDEPPPAAASASAAPGMVDPMQWWGALTSQFQQIAANAMQDAGSHQAAFEATREMASGALKTATDMAAQMAAQGMQGARAAAAAAGATAPVAPAAAAGKPAAKPRTAARKAAPAAKKAAAPRARRAPG